MMLSSDHPVVWPEGEPCRPSFMVIGAPKCGSTSLYDYIASHPNVHPPAVKELCFLSPFKRHLQRNRLTPASSWELYKGALAGSESLAAAYEAKGLSRSSSSLCSSSSSCWRRDGWLIDHVFRFRDCHSNIPGSGTRSIYRCSSSRCYCLLRTHSLLLKVSCRGGCSYRRLHRVSLLRQNGHSQVFILHDCAIGLSGSGSGGCGFSFPPFQLVTKPF